MYTKEQTLPLLRTQHKNQIHGRYELESKKGRSLSFSFPQPNSHSHSHSHTRTTANASKPTKPLDMKIYPILPCIILRNFYVIVNCDHYKYLTSHG